ncbi:MAG: preprotein translocase subunit SecE [Planctomycetes bacterium]|nr:preprotein translocase subunit SecE [Planctomycetota bacterium]
MARNTDGTTLTGNLLSFGLYKRNQGRLTRQLTALAVVLVICFGAWTLSQGPLSDYRTPLVRVGVPLALSVLGAWFAFRLIHLPRFADFLISVEAEMDKVSWASREELHRATAVVIVTMTFLGIVLLMYDFIWVWLFTLLGVLKQA